VAIKLRATRWEGYMEHAFESILRRLLSRELTQKEALNLLFLYEEQTKTYFKAEIEKLKNATSQIETLKPNEQK
jgi:hypothetical protein